MRRRARPRSPRGWFHTGDLAVRHPDGYVEIKDRAKDIIISGGENVSSLEVEECLYRHPHVMEAAVVARPDSKWGETPCAFVTLKAGATGVDRDRHHRVVPQAPRAFQGAAHRGLRATAEDVDRQDPEVRAARASEGDRQPCVTQLTCGAEGAGRARRGRQGIAGRVNPLAHLAQFGRYIFSRARV